MFEMGRNNMLLIYLTNKKDKLHRKRKYLVENEMFPKCFRKHFRMGKDAFHELFTMLDPYIDPKTTRNYRKLSTSKKFAMVL